VIKDKIQEIEKLENEKLNAVAQVKKEAFEADISEIQTILENIKRLLKLLNRELYDVKKYRSYDFEVLDEFVEIYTTYSSQPPKEFEQLFKLLKNNEYCEYKILKEIDVLKDNCKSAALVWYEIFKKEFKINHKYQAFLYEVLRGAMLNIEDGERNISFKVETFRTILNRFYETLEKNSLKGDKLEREAECDGLMGEALYAAGIESGEKFGIAFANMLKGKKQFNKKNDEDNISNWCRFDSEVGFGIIKFNPGERKIVITNLFLQDAKSVIRRNYNEFFKGYAQGVIAKIGNLADIAYEIDV